MSDSYRPGPAHHGDNYALRSDSYPSRCDSYRPLLLPPPGTESLPPPSSMYRFGSTGDFYRPKPPDPYRNSHDRYEFGRRGTTHASLQDERDIFTFRSEIEAPRFPPAAYQSLPQGRRTATRWEGHRGPNPRTSYFPVHDRPILHTNRETTPDRLPGMNEGVIQFIPMDELSESEAEMDLESDAAIPTSSHEVEDSDRAPQAKKICTEASVPKWSNPDPYTALPPTGESYVKRPDFIAWIRKAKVTNKDGVSHKPAAGLADYISFNEEPSSTIRPGAFIAPEQDQQVISANQSEKFSHFDSLHLDRSLQSCPTVDVKPTKKPVDTTDIPLFVPLPDRPKKRKRDERVGQILFEWLPQSHHLSTPWCDVDHSNTRDMRFWLHKEICDFYEFVRPHMFEEDVRRDLVARIRNALKSEYPSCDILSFGSFAAGLYLPTADMDLVLVSREFRTSGEVVYGKSKKFLRKISTTLVRKGIAQQFSCEEVFGAKVPIVKFVDRMTGLRVDISFENMTGVKAISTFLQWREKYPAMPVIVALVKQFLLMRGLNEVFTGGLGGFSVICLVTSYLQLQPSAQQLGKWVGLNLGDILLGFFDFYGSRFNLSGVRISLDPPGYVPKSARGLSGKLEKNMDKLSIIDPNRSDNDISGGSHQIKLVLHCFARANTDLECRMKELGALRIKERRGLSILGPIIGGNYSSFQKQRDRLRAIHQGLS